MTGDAGVSASAAGAPQDDATDAAPEAKPLATEGLGTRIVALLAVRVVALVAGFVASIAGARLLGTAGMGAVGQALTIAAVAAMLANLGLNISTIYELRRSRADTARIVDRLLGLGVLTGAVALLLAAGAVIATAIVPGLQPAILATAAPLAVSILVFELGGALLLGLDRQTSYVRVALIEGVGSLVLTLAILATVAPTADGFLIAAAGAYLLGAAYALVVVRGQVGRLRVAWDTAFTRTAVGFGLRGQAGNIIQFLNLRLDLLFVPVMLDLGAAGIYLIAVRISEAVLIAGTSAATLLFPMVAGQADTRHTTTTEEVVRGTLLVVGAGTLALCLVASPLLVIAFGPDYGSGDAAVRITAIAMIPLALFRLLSGDLRGRGRPGLVSIAALVALGITIAGNLVLIPAIGIAGAATTSLLAYTVAAVALVVAYRSVTGASPLQLVPTPADAVRIVRRGGAILVRGRRGA